MPTSERGLRRTRRRATRNQKWKRWCWWWRLYWWWWWWRSVCAGKLRGTITCGKRVFHVNCDGVRGRIRICGSVCARRHDIPYVVGCRWKWWRWWFCTNRARHGDPVRSSTNSRIRHTTL
ncbi:hypothetical protein EV401DRAFT_1976022 [Pisolithus croceorrhizus]|nr:hypothetical protein EV401DRAFT_1976022 [Pisolithus croceorrhizus]